MDQLVKDFMNKNPAWLEKGETVGKAVQIMNERGIGSVVVTESGKPVGIFSERDVDRVIRQSVLKVEYWRGKGDFPISQLKLGEVMSKPLVTIGPNVSSSEAHQVMIKKNVRHLPVVEEGKLVGILAERDILRAKALV